MVALDARTWKRRRHWRPSPPWPTRRGSPCSGCSSTQGPTGLPAGEIAERLGVVASTLSFHLKELDRAGLLRSWRRQRQIFYAADYEGTRRAAGLPDPRLLPGPPRDLRRPAPASPPARDTRRCEVAMDRQDLQRAVPVHRQLGPQHHGRVRAESLGPGPLPGLLGRQPSQGPRPSDALRLLQRPQLPDRRPALEELGRVRRARRTRARFRVHRLRQRRRRDLPGLAGPADDARTGGSRTRRRSSAATRRPAPSSSGLRLPRQPHQDLRRAADGLARPAVAAARLDAIGGSHAEAGAA